MVPRYEAWLATISGREDLMTPYFWKGAKWLRGLEFMVMTGQAFGNRLAITMKLMSGKKNALGDVIQSGGVIYLQGG